MGGAGGAGGRVGAAIELFFLIFISWRKGRHVGGGGGGCGGGVGVWVARGGGGGGEIVLSADFGRAVYVQSPMHGVHIWPKVWTPETLRASQSERDTSVPCCLYFSEDSSALAYISTW